MVTKEEAKREIKKLIERFDQKSPSELKTMNEETVKKNFILPLFKQLGWDVDSDDVSAEEDIFKKRVRNFLKKHPDSEMAPDAKQVVDKLKSREAENAYETAKFYEARKAPESAVIYYKDIAQNYPDTEWAKKAQERLNELEKK